MLVDSVVRSLLAIWIFNGVDAALVVHSLQQRTPSSFFLEEDMPTSKKPTPEEARKLLVDLLNGTMKARYRAPTERFGDAGRFGDFAAATNEWFRRADLMLSTAGIHDRALREQLVLDVSEIVTEAFAKTNELLKMIPVMDEREARHLKAKEEWKRAVAEGETELSFAAWIKNTGSEL